MEMVEVEVSDLKGPALDWAVGVATDQKVTIAGFGAGKDHNFQVCILSEAFAPSTDWSQGGPLISEHKVYLSPCLSGKWKADAMAVFTVLPDVSGLTPLIAACRAIVAANIGQVVKVPAVLVEASRDA